MSAFWFGVTLGIGIVGFLCTLSVIVIFVASIIVGEREDRRRERLIRLEGTCWREPVERREMAARN